MDKLKQMQDIMKLQKTIAEAREAGKDKQIPVEIVEEKEVVNTLRSEERRVGKEC